VSKDVAQTKLGKYLLAMHAEMDSRLGAPQLRKFLTHCLLHSFAHRVTV
jgi:hypothetical protein